MSQYIPPEPPVKDLDFCYSLSFESEIIPGRSTSGILSSCNFFLPLTAVG